jgi:hypothetical protein
MQKTYESFLFGQVEGLQKGRVASEGVSESGSLPIVLETLRCIKQAIYSTMKFIVRIIQKISKAIKWREHTTISPLK